MATPAQRIPLQATSGVTPLASASPFQVFPAQVIVDPAQALTTVMPGAANRKLRIFVTDIVLSNSAATAGIVSILDGLTVIFAANMPATSSQVVVDFTTPLAGTAGNTLSIQSSSASANINWTITGYAAST
jgi:hypothetical protein